jgi:hypothetical protein
MRSLSAIVFAALAAPAWAEMRDEEHVVGNKLVKIAVFDTLEIMTVGPSDYENMQVLSGADVEIVAFAGDPDSVALLGQPVVVAEVTGTHSCEEGDARAYYVVTLGDVPAPEGPVTTCQELTVSVTPGAVQLEAVPMGEGEFWAWSPGKGWRNRLE